MIIQKLILFRSQKLPIHQLMMIGTKNNDIAGVRRATDCRWYDVAKFNVSIKSAYETLRTVKFSVFFCILPIVGKAITRRILLPPLSCTFMVTEDLFGSASIKRRSSAGDIGSTMFAWFGIWSFYAPMAAFDAAKDRLPGFKFIWSRSKLFPAMAAVYEWARTYKTSGHDYPMNASVVTITQVQG